MQSLPHLCLAEAVGQTAQVQRIQFGQPAQRRRRDLRIGRLAPIPKLLRVGRRRDLPQTLRSARGRRASSQDLAFGWGIASFFRLLGLRQTRQAKQAILDLLPEVRRGCLSAGRQLRRQPRVHLHGPAVAGAVCLEYRGQHAANLRQALALRSASFHAALHREKKLIARACSGNLVQLALGLLIDEEVQKAHEQVVPPLPAVLHQQNRLRVSEPAAPGLLANHCAADQPPRHRPGNSSLPAALHHGRDLRLGNLPRVELSIHPPGELRFAQQRQQVGLGPGHALSGQGRIADLGIRMIKGMHPTRRIVHRRGAERLDRRQADRLRRIIERFHQPAEGRVAAGVGQSRNRGDPHRLFPVLQGRHDPTEDRKPLVQRRQPQPAESLGKLRRRVRPLLKQSPKPQILHDWRSHPAPAVPKKSRTGPIRANSTRIRPAHCTDRPWRLAIAASRLGKRPRAIPIKRLQASKGGAPTAREASGYAHLLSPPNARSNDNGQKAAQCRSTGNVRWSSGCRTPRAAAST